MYWWERRTVFLSWREYLRYAVLSAPVMLVTACWMHTVVELHNAKKVDYSLDKFELGKWRASLDR